MGRGIGSYQRELREILRAQTEPIDAEAARRPLERARAFVAPQHKFRRAIRSMIARGIVSEGIELRSAARGRTPHRVYWLAGSGVDRSWDHRLEAPGVPGVWLSEVEHVEREAQRASFRRLFGPAATPATGGPP